MTMIHTIEDLIRVLDDNPEWLEAMRARLLTRELLEMPNTLAQFMESTNRRFDKVNEQLAQFMESANRRFDKVNEQLAQFMESANRRFDKVNEQLAQFMESTNRRFDKVDEHLAEVENSIQRIYDGMGPLRGAHARNAALSEYDLIAEDMGLNTVRLLTVDEIRPLADELRATGISRDDYLSFRKADILFKAEHPRADVCYVAVEVSFTVDKRDTTRAVRNARYLSDLTNQEAYAAVAGMYIDSEAKSVVESGAVHWYALSPRSMQIE